MWPSVGRYKCPTDITPVESLPRMLAGKLPRRDLLSTR